MQHAEAGQTEAKVPSSLKAHEKFLVSPEDSATKWRGEDLNVLSTPTILGHVEETCLSAIQPYLPQGKITVGTAIELKHLAPTPIGKSIDVRVELKEMNGNRAIFHFEVEDTRGRISEGTHERYVVDKTRFLEKIRLRAES